MAGTKMASVALLLLAMLVASSTVIPAAEAFCFTDCYSRCANGKIGNLPCTNMCTEACVVPTKTPDGVDLSTLAAGLGK